jgi:hypothetical protein
MNPRETHRATIARLRKQLAAEKSLSRALGNLDFSPNQNPEKIRALRRATTERDKITTTP